jgi:hypothetical protein
MNINDLMRLCRQRVDRRSTPLWIRFALSPKARQFNALSYRTCNHLESVASRLGAIDTRSFGSVGMFTGNGTSQIAIAGSKS